jgi:hypothetical protein
MRDLFNHTNPVVALAPVAVALANNTAQVCAIIDRKGYDSVTYNIITGTLADADATFAVTMDEGDDAALADAAAVAAADLLGTYALASFDFSADSKCLKIGYRGSKRYTRLTITPSNNAGNAPLAVIAQLGYANVSPTPNPPV